MYIEKAFMELLDKRFPIDDMTEFKPITERAYADRTDAKLLEDYHGMQEDQKKRLLAYVEALKKIESLEDLK